MKWSRIGTSISSDRTTITYGSTGTAYEIESRKRLIPHSNGRPGGWWYTSYWVVKDGEDVKELYALKDAKAWVERSME